LLAAYGQAGVIEIPGMKGGSGSKVKTKSDREGERMMPLPAAVNVL